MKRIAFLLLVLLACGCSSGRPHSTVREHYARYFIISEGSVITVSPYDGTRDTLHIDRPLGNIICMSGSYIGFLEAIGKDSVVSAVSGIGYVTDSLILGRYARGEVFDVGYEAAPDYERILAINPDLLVTYKVSAGDSPFVQRLKDLGVNVIVLYEHLEEHPLARAEYIRLFGALTGEIARADSIFAEVCSRYESLSRPSSKPVKVLLNTPYAGIWYIPGEDNYMSRLIRDAGGEVLGAEKGSFSSRGISLEEALLYSREADFWLNTGRFDTRDILFGSNPSLSGFSVSAIYNNTKRATPGGGNDFWESGPVRPDVILSDLRKIFEGSPEGLEYYKEVR